MLDYTIQQPEGRVAFVETWLTELGENIKDKQLELAANYILHAADKSLANHAKQNKAENKQNLILDENTENEIIKPRKGSNSYTKPNTPVPWEHPNLVPLKNAIDQLELVEILCPDPRTQYNLRRWILELRLDAKARVPDHTIKTAATWSSPPPLDLEMAGLDWSNSFHIKHIVRHYSELRQSDHSKFDIEYFDALVERTNLPEWQKHVFIRYIDGLNNIIVAREVAEKFNKILYPGFTSKVMRQIYRKIADQAEAEDVRRSTRNLPQRKCPRCGQSFPDHEIWWRKGQRSCKHCLGKKNV